MLQLILAATLACPPVSANYGYQQSYSYTPRVVYSTTPAYQQAYQYQAPTYYQTPTYYQAPVYSAVVGEYLRQESESKEKIAQAAKLDQLLDLLKAQAQQPAPQPQPQFSAPPPQYASPQYAAPQAPAKSIPQPIPQFQGIMPPAFGTAQGDATPPPPVPSKPQPNPAPSFGDATWGAAPAASFATASVPASRCAGCHGADTYATKGGGIRFFQLDGSPDIPQILEHKAEIVDDVMSGRMPKGGPRLSQAETMAVFAWMAGPGSGNPQASAGGFGR